MHDPEKLTDFSAKIMRKNKDLMHVAQKCAAVLG